MAVYITAAGAYLPGEPVENDRIEDVLGMLDGKPSRLRNRILRSNGIRARHYALGADGETTELNEELAAKAVLAALGRSNLELEDVEMLAAGTTLGDVPIPGFASIVHGRLGVRPMEILSAGGVCCSSMAALAGAYRAVLTGERANAIVVGSELVSRSLKATRFRSAGEPPLVDPGLEEMRGSSRDFDSEFLRWILSDGAGSVVLEASPGCGRPSLRVEWIELKSFANECETCMYAGMAHKELPRAGNTWLDQETIAEAERAQFMLIRQDTALLPNIVRLGVEEYLRLIRSGRIDPAGLDHFLCHYSSHYFKGEILKLLNAAGLAIPEHKWFTNLYTKGNTGAASAFIMLEKAMNGGRFRPDDRILLMVPESGRFTVAFALLTCVGPSAAQLLFEMDDVEALAPDSFAVADLDSGPDPVVRRMLIDMALVWSGFERRLRQTRIVRRIEAGQETLDDYRMLLRNLRQQVVEGARWIARAASNLSVGLFPFRSSFISHAGEEHRDFQMLERDYCAAGGRLEEIVDAPKNIGSEALSSFMFDRASQPDPVELVGAMFVIEGLGRLKADRWATLLQRQLGLSDGQLTFLRYHGQKDADHFERLRQVLDSGVVTEDLAKRIVKTAKVVARLYVLQLEEIDNF